MGGRRGRAGPAAPSAGRRVSAEYYFNDAGAQIDRFADSLLAAARHQPAPDDGYVGDYIDEIAATVVKNHPDVLGLPSTEANGASSGPRAWP